MPTFLLLELRRTAGDRQTRFSRITVMVATDAMNGCDCLYHTNGRKDSSPLSVRVYSVRWQVSDMTFLASPDGGWLQSGVSERPGAVPGPLPVQSVGGSFLSSAASHR